MWQSFPCLHACAGLPGGCLQMICSWKLRNSSSKFCIILLLYKCQLLQSFFPSGLIKLVGLLHSLVLAARKDSPLQVGFSLQRALPHSRLHRLAERNLLHACSKHKQSHCTVVPGQGVRGYGAPGCGLPGCVSIFLIQRAANPLGY